MAQVSHLIVETEEGMRSLLALIKWPLVAFLLMASFLVNPASADTQSSVSARTVEKTVRAKFAKVPVLIKIAKCESRFRQYDQDGSPLYNEGGSSAVGVMQIMSSVHSKTARKLGYDIKTTEGNLGYALYLYKNEGTTPWKASRHCWG